MRVAARVLSAAPAADREALYAARERSWRLARALAPPPPARRVPRTSPALRDPAATLRRAEGVLEELADDRRAAIGDAEPVEVAWLDREAARLDRLAEDVAAIAERSTPRTLRDGRHG